jgi:DNA-binding response OmpR family regulator
MLERVVRSESPHRFARMEFRLLGPLEVADRDRSVALGGVKQRSLLAVLMLYANEVVSSGRLIADLWGEAPRAPTVLVQRGPRPGLAPQDTRTRVSWSLSGSAP